MGILLLPTKNGRRSTFLGLPIKAADKAHIPVCRKKQQTEHTSLSADKNSRQSTLPCLLFD